MKKQYNQPGIEVIAIEDQVELLSASIGVTWDEIGYGGVDIEGIMNPDAHELSLDIINSNL